MEHRRAEWAAEIRAELARQNLTQTDLSNGTGLPQSTLSRRLNSEHPFNVDELDRICTFLGVPVFELHRRVAGLEDAA